jgi:hypothetical protein
MAIKQSKTLLAARSALDGWKKVPAGHASCSFQWTALFQLIAITQHNQDLQQAIEYDRALLDPGQMQLPDSLEKAFHKAILCWDNKNFQEASFQLNKSIELAKDYGYL